MLGTANDWKEIRARLDKLATFKDDTLSEWSKVLALVLDQFVAAFERTFSIPLSLSPFRC